MATLTGKIIADFSTTLATKLSVGGQTASLLSAIDDDGVSLPAGKYHFSLDKDNAKKEHIICDLSGTSLTNIKSVSRQGVITTGVVREHRIGANVSITDFLHIKAINDLISGNAALDATKPLKYDADPTIADDKELTTKKYVDTGVLAGAPNATLTTKGVVEIATAAEIDAGTELGTTEASLAVNPKYLKDGIYKTQLPTADEKAALAGTGTPSGANKYVTADTPVNLTGNQTVAGIKTFSSIPVLPASDPTTDNQATRRAYVEPARAKTAYSQMFSGSVPTSWTDLNLSSVVGSNEALVYLRVRSYNASAAQTIRFRKKGETDDVHSESRHASVFYVNVVGGNTIGYVLVKTDSSGIIQWVGNSGTNAVIHIEAFWRLF